MSRDAVDVLRAVRARLEDPARWCKGASHRGEASCLLGALDVESNDHAGTWGPCDRALRRALPSGDVEHVSTWNDRPTTTHADVLALLDRAIASLEGQPK